MLRKSDCRDREKNMNSFDHNKKFILVQLVTRSQFLTRSHRE